MPKGERRALGQSRWALSEAINARVSRVADWAEQKRENGNGDYFFRGLLGVKESQRERAREGRCCKGGRKKKEGAQGGQKMEEKGRKEAAGEPVGGIGTQMPKQKIEARSRK